MKKSSIFYIIALLLLLVGLGVTIIIVNSQNQDLRSRASNETGLAAKALQNTLNPPYVRLAPRSIVVKSGVIVPVDVFVHANGVVLSEIGIGLSFDPALVKINPESVQGSEVLPVVNVENVKEGSVYFSIFHGIGNDINPEVYNKEFLAGTIYLQVIGERGVVVVKRTQDDQAKTEMYGQRDEKTGDIVTLVPALGEAQMIISSR